MPVYVPVRGSTWGQGMIKLEVLVKKQAAIKSGGHYFGRLGRFWRAGRRAPQATKFAGGGVFTVNTFSHGQAVAIGEGFFLHIFVVSHFVRQKLVATNPFRTRPQALKNTPRRVRRVQAC